MMACSTISLLLSALLISNWSTLVDAKVNRLWERTQFAERLPKIVELSEGISIFIRSEGYYDAELGNARTYIQVNGKEQSKKNSGHNIVLVDGETGAVEQSLSFNTLGSREDANDMAKTLNNWVKYSPGKVVLVAVQDDSSYSLTHSAKAALVSVGAREPFMYGYRGSYALLGYTGPGKPSWVQQVQHAKLQGPSIISTTIERKAIPGYNVMYFSKRNDKTDLSQRCNNQVTDITKTINNMTEFRTCGEIKSHFPDIQYGHYNISPAGKGQGTIRVCCPFDGDDMNTTVLESDLGEKSILVVGYKEPGSYHKRITYNGSLDLVVALINNSATCEQLISWDCRGSKLLENGNAWWVSRDGENMTYWGGATGHHNKCGCALQKGGCEGGKNCNCDAEPPRKTFDFGWLTDKSKLPVKDVFFGDTGNQKNGSFWVSPLRCRP